MQIQQEIQCTVRVKKNNNLLMMQTTPYVKLKKDMLNEMSEHSLKGMRAGLRMRAGLH
jgi:hypothetical protein